MDRDGLLSNAGLSEQGPFRHGHTDYGQEIEKIKEAMGPSVEDQLGRSPTGWERPNSTGWKNQ